MSDYSLIDKIRSAVNQALLESVEREMGTHPPGFRQMFDYQMMWDAEGLKTGKGGKKLRPLILLLTCHALGGEWSQALPAASALELIHNFSLVHDDIQDKSPMRHGRSTVWVKWGEAQAINTGDAMLTLANLEILRLISEYPEEIVLQAAEILHQATFDLTGGQYLDLAFENAEDICIDDYWHMIHGKTGALFAASFGIGAHLAGKRKDEIQKYLDMGLTMGSAFQVQDDYLGLWGEDMLTGKSSNSDLAARKKTYPVLYALANVPAFREVWEPGRSFTIEDVETMKELLEREGCKEATTRMFGELYQSFMNQLDQLFPENGRSGELIHLISSLFHREL